MTRRRLAIAGGVLAVAFVVFVWVWFEPQKLVLDDRVDDPFPTVAAEPEPEPEASTTAPVAASTPSTATTSTTVPQPVVLGAGSFRSIDHGTTGTATIYELPDGSRVLRFEQFETSNGPDVRIYLSTAPSDSAEGSFDDDYVDLGAMRGNIGDQNYDIPPDVDLSRYQSVVVWCRRFSSGFGVAPIA